MTAQIHDIYMHNRKKYVLVALSSGKPFEPRNYGLEPHPRCTACWRGHWCEYSITQQGLFLQKLHMFNKDENYPPLNGREVSPQEYEEDIFGLRLYKNLNMRIPYTGKILLGDGLMGNYTVNMGYHNGWAYREMMEFVLEDGWLMECNDLSQLAEAQREKINRMNIDFRYPNGISTEEFVETSFSLDYADKAWWLDRLIDAADKGGDTGV